MPGMAHCLHGNSKPLYLTKMSYQAGVGSQLFVAPQELNQITLRFMERFGSR